MVIITVIIKVIMVIIMIIKVTITVIMVILIIIVVILIIIMVTMVIIMVIVVISEKLTGRTALASEELTASGLSKKIMNLTCLASQFFIHRHSPPSTD